MRKAGQPAQAVKSEVSFPEAIVLVKRKGEETEDGAFYDMRAAGGSEAIQTEKRGGLPATTSDGRKEVGKTNRERVRDALESKKADTTAGLKGLLHLSEVTIIKHAKDLGYAVRRGPGARIVKEASGSKHEAAESESRTLGEHGSRREELRMQDVAKITAAMKEKGLVTATDIAEETGMSYWRVLKLMHKEGMQVRRGRWPGPKKAEERDAAEERELDASGLWKEDADKIRLAIGKGLRKGTDISMESGVSYSVVLRFMKKTGMEVRRGRAVKGEGRITEEEPSRDAKIAEMMKGAPRWMLATMKRKEEGQDSGSAIVVANEPNMNNLDLEEAMKNYESKTVPAGMLQEIDSLRRHLADKHNEARERAVGRLVLELIEINENGIHRDYHRSEETVPAALFVQNGRGLKPNPEVIDEIKRKMNTDTDFSMSYSDHASHFFRGAMRALHQARGNPLGRLSPDTRALLEAIDARLELGGD
ncbi:MAG: hypothetical protein KGI04_03550 [Candidatus Micrarchaeota archaeon]|nr:hypothetical protein [Candidatus Micrarchaeota archaeon]